jgi:hypothetical protein
MATGTGVNVSKVNAYAVLMPMAGVSVSKANAYAVLNRPAGVNVSKANIYAVLTGLNVSSPLWPAVAFAPGIFGNGYDQYFDLSPAAPPTTFSVVSGALPPGLSLWSQGSLDPTSCLGRIWGYPVAVGTFTFTLRASSAYGSADKTFSITVTVPIIVGVGGGAAFF